jgi:hypothetical protein
VAKEGDGWLSREMVGQLGRWVAKLVSHLLATAALWVRIQTSLKKYKMGKKHALARQKNILLPLRQLSQF